MRLPRLYLNGFPKSGLHLVELMVRGLYEPARKKGNWFGTNAWTTKFNNLEHVAILAAIKPGEYLRGHSGYSEKLEEMLLGMGVGMVLVYRDLRDVVVSQAYHVLSDDDDLKHPARELYPDNLHDVMRVIITGISDFDGIFERWRTYEPWLRKSWVFPVKFRDAIRTPERVARQFFDYVYGLALAHEGRDEISFDGGIRQYLIKNMAKNTKRTDTVTFRKGKLSQWRTEFTPELVDLFKEYDKDNMLMKLGFEKRKDWH